VTRYAFSLATPDDDASLRARMAQDRIPGDLAVSFRREPSYFAGCALQGSRSEVIKCVDRTTREIVGLGARHVTRAFVNGVPRLVGYLSDLRAAPAARGGTLLARGYRFLRALHEADPLYFYYTVIFDTNLAARSTLVGGRAGLPEYRDLGRVLGAAIHLALSKPALTVPGIRFRKAAAGDIPALAAFLNREHARKQLAAVWTREDLESGFGGTLDIADFAVALDGDGIVAAAAAWDQGRLRQTFVEGYSARLCVLRAVNNLLARVLPLKEMPAPGQPVPYFYLSAIAVRDNDATLFAALLRHIYRERRTGPWSYCIVSLHERDPLCAALDGYRAIPMNGRLFSVHFRDSREPPDALDARVPYVDLARA
jgi:hypothetical protein